MTVVNTEYENLGPVVKELRLMLNNEFFQVPDEPSVYRMLVKRPDDALCLDLDDLTVSVFKLSTVVEPREVEQIDIKVELA